MTLSQIILREQLHYNWTSNIEIGGGLSGFGNIDFPVINNNNTAIIAEITVVPGLKIVGLFVKVQVKHS